MIGYINGQIVTKTQKYIVVNVSGIGYNVFIKPTLIEKLQEKNGVELYTHLHVTETDLTLFGFQNNDELILFKHFIQVSGIGPKSALNIMDLGSPEELVSAITQEQHTYLAQASGIGPKTAKKIIVELQNKVLKMKVGKSVAISVDDDVSQALKVMGYYPQQIQEVLKQLPKDITDTKEKIRFALKYLREK